MAITLTFRLNSPFILYLFFKKKYERIGQPPLKTTTIFFLKDKNQNKNNPFFLVNKQTLLKLFSFFLN